MIVKDFFIEEAVKPEYRKQVRDKLNEAENFFKHANRDHVETLDFNPQQSEMMILDAIRQHSALTRESSRLLAVFRLWFLVTNQKVFKRSEEQQNIIAQAVPMMERVGKTEFFNLVLRQLIRQGI